MAKKPVSKKQLRPADKPEPYQPTASEVAMLLMYRRHLHMLDKGLKELSRFRVRRSTLRGIGIRTRIEGSFEHAVTVALELNYNWTMFPTKDHLALVSREAVEDWTLLGSKRISDVLKKLRQGNRSALDQVANAFEVDVDEEEDGED